MNIIYAQGRKPVALGKRINEPRFATLSPTLATIRSELSLRNTSAGIGLFARRC